MIFYRNHYTHNAGESAGYEWFTSKHLAKVAARAWDKEQKGKDERPTETDMIIIVTQRKRLLAALNHYASHPDNG